jgi:hypothetical protein
MMAMDAFLPCAFSEAIVVCRLSRMGCGPESGKVNGTVTTSTPVVA